LYSIKRGIRYLRFFLFKKEKKKEKKRKRSPFHRVLFPIFLLEGWPAWAGFSLRDVPLMRAVSLNPNRYFHNTPSRDSSLTI